MDAVAHRRARIVLGGALGAVWLLTIATGLAMLEDYENAPGIAARPPERWPADSRIARLAGTPTLVMFVHPLCPCSRASIEELDRIMAQADVPPAADVVFLVPAGTAGYWGRTALWRHARRIRGVTVVRDDDGAEARRFDAATSGQTVLYDGAGRLLFSGGITGSRGHAGDNAGRDTILARLADASEADAARAATPVFGCSLRDPPVGAAGWTMTDGG